MVGPRAAGLSASTVTRLKQVWEQEFEDWSKRSLEGKEYVYLWADGVHFNIRLEEDRQCILVLMGATADGHKELIAVADGYRESEQSWLTLLLDVKSRGPGASIPSWPPAMAPWASGRRLTQVYPTTREQRCWVHKTANVLDKLPKRLQPAAKEQAPSNLDGRRRQSDAEQAFDTFLETYEPNIPRRSSAYRRIATCS